MGNAELRDFTYSLTIKAPAENILRSFFDHEALRQWWHIKRSLATPRTFGAYAVEWDVTDWSDELLGRLGGVFHGTVITWDPPNEFFVANAYWLAPDGEAIGPMAFEVTCTAARDGVIVRVRQSGCDESARWKRYYELMGHGLAESLERMRFLLETRRGKI